MENGNAGNRERKWAEETPDFERITGVEQLPQGPEQGVEQGPMSPERAALERLGRMSTEGAMPAVPVMPPTDDTMITDTGTVDDDNPDTAEDGEKIEREWAERIRKIVELTKDNPRVEQIEVNKLKADYMKKRFNRELGDRN